MCHQSAKIRKRFVIKFLQPREDLNKKNLIFKTGDCKKINFQAHENFDNK